MACIEHSDLDISANKSGGLIALWDRFSHFIAKLLVARAKRRQQKIDRAAFLNLLGKEDWLYRDMGVHPGDVEWASKLPLETNAAMELEKIRQMHRRSI